MALYQFMEYLKETLDIETIDNIASYGVASAGTSDMIYYQDHEVFYHEHQSLIEDALHDLIYNQLDMDLVEVISNGCTKYEEMQGIRMIVSWFLIEWSCIYIMDELRSDLDD